MAKGKTCTKSSPVVIVAGLLSLLAIGASAPALGDGVYSSGLMELGDGQPPPGMAGLADIEADAEQSGPDWADLFAADGSPRDDYPFDAQGNAAGNGIPDFLELFGGEWAVFIRDDLSRPGAGREDSALTIDGRVANGYVDADHDIGNVYFYSTIDTGGNRVLYAAAEPLGLGASSLAFEFNQDHFRLGHGGYGIGEPWAVIGNRAIGDVLVRLTFDGSGLVGTEASTWAGSGWLLLSAVSGEGCDAAESLCAISNGSSIDGGPWASQQIEAGRFVEVGVNTGALLGAQPSYLTVRISTPQDIAFGYFGEAY